MGNKRVRRRIHSQTIVGIVALAVLAFTVSTAQASFLNSCTTYCHGMPPQDSIRKGNPHFDSKSSAFLGNHSNHLPAAAAATNCSICHSPVALTDFGHENGIIAMANTIKGYSSTTIRAKYDKGVFVNQTAIPNLTNATCSNVNCHFETKTPVWGSSPNLAACNMCHNDIPSTFAHTTHDANLIACLVCHPEHFSDATPFIHATSAGRPVAVIVGSYAGSNNSYLPSQAAGRIVGSCTTTYCHSSGNINNAGVAVAPTAFRSISWNAAIGCSGCHGDGLANGKAHPVYASGAVASNTANSHVKHVESSLLSCNYCHDTTSTDTTIPPTSVLLPGAHLNGTDDVSFKLNGGKTGTYNATAKTCATTYCHGTAASPAWGASTSCVSCHDAIATGLALRHDRHYNSTTPPTLLVGTTDAHTTSAYVYSCLACHPSNQHSTGPASAIVPLQDAAVTGTKVTAYTKGTASAVDGKGFNYTTNGACTSVCHTRDGVTAGSAIVAQNWGTAVTSSCGVCHNQAGDATPVWSAPHTKHINFYAANSNITCGSCHTGTAANNNLLQATAQARIQHPNALKEVALDAFAGGSVNGAQGAQQCSNTYCHSQGISITAPAHAALSWSGVTACNSCHTGGVAGSTQGPTYVSGTPKANSHPRHTYTCDTCHSAVVNAAGTITNPALHVNKVYNIAQGGTATFTITVSGTATTPTQCSAISCHGGSAATWGAALNCQDCHGNGASASVTDFGATFWNNGIISKFQMTGTGSWAGNGHGLASGTYPGSANPAANFTVIANFCEWCHDATVGHNNAGNPFRLRNLADVNWGKNGVCMSCHAIGSPGLTVGGQLRNPVANKVSAYHYGAKHSTALSGGQFCWDCHDPHGTGNTNQFMIRPLPARASDTVTGAPTAQSATSVVFVLSAVPTGSDYAKSAAPFNGICNVCHTTASHYTGTAGDGHNSGTRCTSCHSHNGDDINRTSAFTPIGGGVSSGGSPCYGCHSASNVMTASTSFFHHVLDNATPDLAPNTGTYPSSTTVLACTSCHSDHNYFNPGKNANLRTGIGIAGSTSARDNHDFSTTTPYGICVSCHSTSLTKSTAQTVAGTVATIAIDGTATGYQAAIHNYTTTSLFGTLSFSANCVKCHSDEQFKDKQTSAMPRKFGPHYSVQRSLLNPMGATVQPAAGADFCYRCHHKVGDTAPGNGAAKTAALKDYFGSRNMTAASEDTFSAMQRGSATTGRHDVSSYKGLHKDDETRASIAAAKHVECVDCHDPHLAKAGNHTAGSAALAGVLTGTAGVGVTTWGANWTAVTAYNPATTTAPLITVTAEWQLCFKCHSAANANAATWGGTGAAAFTDLGLEFSPNNSSGHPIVTGLNNYPNSLAPKALTAARMKAPWTNIGTQVMTCSDCHATDSAASKGPHGSSVKWMLAGTNKAWPYTTTAGNGASTGTLFRLATYNTGDGTANGLFCLNCHTIRPATGGNNWHINGDTTAGEHGGNAIMACASCHIRVPHGGKISRLLQTTNAPARYKSNGNGATSSFTQFGPTTGTVKGSAVSNANFNSSCGQHSGTGGEAW